MRANNKYGFTLLELVIAITILSLVTLLIGGGFRLGLNAWEKGEEETDNTQKLRVLSGLLSQQIKSAYPYRIKIDDERAVIFQGESDSVLFATSLTDISFHGFRWIRYSYKDGALFYQEGVLPDKKLIDKISGDGELLDSDIEGIEFSYYSPDDEEWKDEWEFGKDLPGAVKIRVSNFHPIFISIPMSSGKKGDSESGIS